MLYKIENIILDLFEIISHLLLFLNGFFVSYY